MREPNFGEGQVQQSVNSAIQYEILESIGFRISAKVPTLPREYRLGWDTGFYFRWMPHRRLADHDGCNFFIQYKLSKELTSPGAAQYESWRSPYMRFRIPYRDGGVDDYTQWDRLKILADQGYPTFYATNSVLQLSILEELEETGRLLEETPFLDVRRVINQHVYVTFTRTSPHFVLHSEKEIIDGNRWSLSREKLFGEERNNLEEGNKQLFTAIKVLGRESSSRSLAQLIESYPTISKGLSERRREEVLIHQFYYLKSAFERIYGIIVHRYLFKSQN